MVSFTSNLPVENEPIPFRFGLGWNFANDFTAEYFLSFDPEVTRARRSADKKAPRLTHADFLNKISNIFDSAGDRNNSQALHINLNAAEIKTQFVMKTETVTELRKFEADWSLVPLQHNFIFMQTSDDTHYTVKVNFDVKTMNFAFGPDGSKDGYLSIGYDFPEPLVFQTHFVQRIPGCELLETMNSTFILQNNMI